MVAMKAQAEATMVKSKLTATMVSTPPALKLLKGSMTLMDITRAAQRLEQARDQLESGGPSSKKIKVTVCQHEKSMMLSVLSCKSRDTT